MRDSFFHLKEWYMTTERPEDFELVRDYVVEQTRKVSLEQLGLDLTLQDTGDFQQGFTIENRRVGQKERLCFVWWDFFACDRWLIILALKATSIISIASKSIRRRLRSKS